MAVEPVLLRRVLACLVKSGTLAVLLRGSHATGRAHPDSDLDLTVLIDGEPKHPYLCWFEPRETEPPLPVSVSTKTIASWLLKRDEPAAWALGFPAVDVARYLWATEEARAQLGEDPSARRPPGPPGLAGFVSTAVKVRRAAAAGDSLALRLYARETALLAPGLLRTLNPVCVPSDSKEAMIHALDLEVAPAHYRDDMLAVTGLAPADDRQVAEALFRLVAETLELLGGRSPEVDPQPQLGHYLADGTLSDYVAEWPLRRR